jgi:hypothetical protein
MRFIQFFLFAILISSASTVIAQTTTADDPYADYSHLWGDEDTKKKKKKGNESDAPQIQPQTIATDTVPNTEEPNISTEEPTQQQLPQQELIPTDSVENQNTQSQETQAQESEDLQPQETQTISPTEVAMPADTVPKQQTQPAIEEPQPDPAPEVSTDETTAVEEETTEPAEEEKPKKEKEKKERKSLKDLEPVSGDFRGGGGGSTSGGSTVNGGATFTVIDGKYYAGLTLQPEFSIWKVGVGLNVPILFDIQEQTFRTEIFKDGVGVARSITYIRFGVQKQDPIYVRVGELNGISIGFGGLVNNYTNSTSFEKRKVGLHYDLNFKGLIGLEGMYSDFDPDSKNLTVFRPYIRPLGFLSIPIVRTLEIGAAFVSDKDQTQRPISDSTFTTYSMTNGAGAFGIDAGINLLRVPFVQIDAFFNYSKLNLLDAGLSDSISAYNADVLNEDIIYAENGSGSSYGVNFRFNFIADLLSTDVRIERLNYTDHYIPQFFDFSYELNKDGRIWATTGGVAKSGIYGSLTGHILQTIKLGGSLMIPDEIGVDAPAVVQVNATAERVADKFTLNGLYLKGNLADLKDAFKLDERSIAKVRLIYHVNKFLAAGMDYYWAFSPADDGSFTATKYVSPYFGLSIQF